MADDRDVTNRDAILDPEDVNSAPTNPSSAATNASTGADPNDEVPVPIAMSAAEIDERAQAVEALRGTTPPSRPDESHLGE